MRVEFANLTGFQSDNSRILCVLAFAALIFFDRSAGGSTGVIAVRALRYKTTGAELTVQRARERRPRRLRASIAMCDGLSSCGVPL